MKEHLFNQARQKYGHMASIMDQSGLEASQY